MNTKFTFLSLFLLIPHLFLFAQNKDFGTWNTIGTEKKIGRWTLETEAELRTKDTVRDIDRWSLQLDVAYKIAKPIEAGFKYQFIFFNDIKYSDIQPRQRYAVYLQAKQKYGDFTFFLREQIQRTIKDERDRIRYNGEHDTYNINPEWEWRNRLKILYNIPKFPVNPSFSVESHYQLNNPDGNKFNKLRFTLSFNYKLSKHHKFELYGLMDKEINENDPLTTYIIGLGYTYSFNKIKK